MSRLFAIAAIALGAACGSSTGSGGNPPPPPPPPPPGSTLGVSVISNKFNPSNGTVLSGGTVTWTWNVAADHNVTFEDGQGNSGTQNSGTHQRTFPTVTTATTFRYRCTLHSSSFTSGMSGQIVVTP